MSDCVELDILLNLMTITAQKNVPLPQGKADIA